MNKTVFLPVLLLFLLLLVGCSQKETIANREWYDSIDLVIQNGLQDEGLTTADILGTEVDQGDTLVFYHKGLQTGVASITHGDKGYSWYRSASYASVLASDQPYGSLSFDFESENKHTRKIVAGVVYSQQIKRLGLFVSGSQVISKTFDQTPAPFYFLIHDPSIDVSSIEVKPLDE
ncbi:hypothetical protein JJB07_04505 [Tumebacillus sp. ITR2]|uniref:Lipoprotein n=1 Tax=Tumebacillus amylolyticus TaxID=2801339 RepID=A0ABS1J6S5_9BACL|nr:hypothetical protein [Tumebacillus amylolyticus]MBL0385905.1 hypothetical protein [Tumebacillus amylolyticus]